MCSFFVLETHHSDLGECQLTSYHRARFFLLAEAYTVTAIDAWIERTQARAPPIKS